MIVTGPPGDEPVLADDPEIPLELKRHLDRILPGQWQALTLRQLERLLETRVSRRGEKIRELEQEIVGEYLRLAECRDRIERLDELDRRVSALRAAGTAVPVSCPNVPERVR